MGGGISHTKPQRHEDNGKRSPDSDFRKVTLIWPAEVARNPRLAVPVGRPRYRLPSGGLQVIYTERELRWTLRLLDEEAGDGRGEVCPVLGGGAAVGDGGVGDRDDGAHRDRGGEVRGA